MIEKANNLNDITTGVSIDASYMENNADLISENKSLLIITLLKKFRKRIPQNHKSKFRT